MIANVASPISVVSDVIVVAGKGGLPKLLFWNRNKDLTGEMESRNIFLASGSGDDLDYGSPWAETGYIDPNKGTNDYSKRHR